MPNSQTVKPLPLDSTTQSLKEKLQLISNALNSDMQRDWEETNVNSKAFIKNKPTGLWSNKTITGNPLSFKKRKPEPAISTKISMEPIQDLHGYDYPWPAGGGKNKFDISKIPSFDSGENGKIVNNGDGSITITTSVGSSGLGCGKKLSELAPGLLIGETYTFTFVTTGTDKYLYFSVARATWSSGQSKTLTQEYLDSYVYFYASGQNTTATISNIQFEKGSIATSYTPYSNICPISGRTQVSLDGCGKNLIPFPYYTGSITTRGITFTVQSDGGVKISGTSTAATNFILIGTNQNTGLPKGNYIVSCLNANNNAYLVVGGSNSHLQYHNITNSEDYEIELTDGILGYFLFQIPNNATVDTTLYPMIRSANVNGTYELYAESNKIAITFPALGHNQWDEEVESGTINYANGKLEPNDNAYRTKNFFPFVDGSEFYFYNTTGVSLGIRFYDKNKNYIGSTALSGSTVVTYNTLVPTYRLTEEDVAFIKFVNSNTGTYNNDIAINYPSTFTTYEPYTNTVYGGTLDLTSGVLTVDKITQSFTSANLYGNYGSDNAPLYYVDWLTYSIKPKGNSNYKNFLSSNYFKTITTTSSFIMENAVIRTQESSNPNKIYFRWDEKSLSEINTAFGSTPLQVCAELATPTTIQLTPQQVQLLKGANTIWMDGDSIELTYIDDSKNVTDVNTDLTNISDNMAFKEGTISLDDHAIGDYLILNNIFYKVIASIQAGDEIIPGTNVTQTTIGAELTVLNA